MSILDWLRRKLAVDTAPQPVEPRRRVVSIPDEALALSRETRRRRAKFAGSSPAMQHPFVVAQHPKAATPAATMAMDDGIDRSLAWAASAVLESRIEEGVSFLGYPVLAELSQRAEHRRIVETIARHMTRNWIKLKAKGGGDKSERIKVIEGELKRLNAQEAFREAVEQDGYFGRGHIFIDLGNFADDVELKTSIGDGKDITSRNKVGRGSLKRLQTVEAMWCYPQGYNTTDPLAPDWYRPSHWYAMSREVHASRMLTFVGREVPDILKPTYSFGGLALTQMAKPYVENWLETRQGVNDIITAFSVFVLKTNLADTLMTNAQDFYRRLDVFNNVRDNRGLMAIDKEQEEFENVSAPLGTLDALQAQSLEQICTVSAIPVIEFCGNQPMGLNASSEGEIRSFYANIQSQQEIYLRPNLEKLIGLIQLSMFGDVDADIFFDFEPLWSMTEKEMAEQQNIKAQTDTLNIDAGIVTPAEARKRLANDPDSAYHGLDENAVPAGEWAGAGEGDDPPKPKFLSRPAVGDAAWNEAEHPRDRDGKFSEEDGGAGASESPGSQHATAATPSVAKPTHGAFICWRD